MQYTFEITIAGCTTNCMHCYVDGGPAPAMSLNAFQYCADKLCAVIDQLQGNVAITLGNEMFCNPDITDILEICRNQLSNYISYQKYSVPTTGLALISKRDTDNILNLLRELGTTGFMLALHGSRDNHNLVTGNPMAFDGLFRTADYLAAKGFCLLFNLIVSKLLAQDIEGVMTQISSYAAKVRLTVPLYVPTIRMHRFQSIRADYHECMNLASAVDQAGISSTSLYQHCHLHSEDAVLCDILEHGFHYEEEKQNSPQWAFFNITHNLDFYYGNVGAHTHYLGNLREMSEDKILSAIQSFGPNYDWNAFYDDSAFECLPVTQIQAHQGSHNYVYPSRADCIYAWLDSLGTKNKLLYASGRHCHG